jgi:hypothetical protein
VAHTISTSEPYIGLWLKRAQVACGDQCVPLKGMRFEDEADEEAIRSCMALQAANGKLAA